MYLEAALGDAIDYFSIDTKGYYFKAIISELLR